MCYEHGREVSEIASLAGCTERTIYNVLRLHRDFGQVHNPSARTQGHPRTLDQQDILYIKSLLDANPCLYLDEIQEQLLDTHGIVAG